MDKPKEICVVFDLDETLGYFSEFSMLWDALIKIGTNKTPSQADFNALLDLYPEFIRPHIFDILKFLSSKKRNKNCNRVVIYTNNQGKTEWGNFIKCYFQDKLNAPKLFDQIIAAFKVGEKRVEICRTSHDKSHSDFVKCTNVPDNTQICFLDDVLHDDMKHDNVYYINVKAYKHDLSFSELIARIWGAPKVKSRFGLANADDDDEKFRKEAMEFLKSYNYVAVKKHDDELAIDVIVAKRVITHLRDFFRLHCKRVRKTVRCRNRYKRQQTRRKRAKNTKK